LKMKNICRIKKKINKIKWSNLNNENTWESVNKSVESANLLAEMLLEMKKNQILKKLEYK
jgi:hypothetical protein